MANISDPYPTTWLLPVAALIGTVLLSIASVCVINRFKRGSQRDVDTDRMEKKQQCSRRQQRINVEGIRVEISDGSLSYCGLITNLSPIGICLKDVPAALSTSKSLLSVLVKGTTDSYRIVARPRWELPQANSGKTIGAEIASCPDNWSEFVHSN